MTVIQTSSESTMIKIEDMNMNELKEECRRRRLHVTGNKQKLIDRLKTNSNILLSNENNIKQNDLQQTQQQQHVQVVKSPNSGVNMDCSPSLNSCKYWLLKSVRFIM
jgi:hypothetical protein